MSLWRSALRYFTAVRQCGVKSLQSFISTAVCLYEQGGWVRNLSLNHILVISAQGNNAKNTGASSSSSSLPSSALLGSRVSRPHIARRPTIHSHQLHKCTSCHVHPYCTTFCFCFLTQPFLVNTVHFPIDVSWLTDHSKITVSLSKHHRPGRVMHQCTNMPTSDEMIT